MTAETERQIREELAAVEDEHLYGDSAPHAKREIPSPIDALSERALLEQIARDAADTRQDIAAILAKVQEVSAQVAPTLDAVLKNPMLKMFLK